jgi:hypothetical protein
VGQHSAGSYADQLAARIDTASPTNFPTNLLEVANKNL